MKTKRKSKYRPAEDGKSREAVQRREADAKKFADDWTNADLAALESRLLDDTDDMPREFREWREVSRAFHNEIADMMKKTTDPHKRDLARRKIEARYPQLDELRACAMLAMNEHIDAELAALDD
ncbi:MAG: hypothetical protein QM770_24675 [Tepidisphaeraceae bacterium]